MRLYASGVVTNEYNDVLLILRDDSRTWAIPGGGVEANELPPAAAAREVEEETGVKVLPVRLVHLNYRPEGTDGALGFTFRCLVRGGKPAPSPESLQVGFYPHEKVPGPMLEVHRHMLQRGLEHRGGAPSWSMNQLPLLIRLARDIIYSYRNLRRRLLRQPPFVPPPTWRMGAFLILQNPDGQVLWVKRRDNDLWNLPGGGPEGLEAPWETAIRETLEETGLHVRLTDLSGVYLKPAKGEIVFSFLGEVTGGKLTLGPESADFAYVASGSEPANTLPKHIYRVAEALQAREVTLFRFQDQDEPSLESCQ